MQITEHGSPDMALISQSQPSVAQERQPIYPRIKYAVITPARNEQEFIEGTLESMVRQTVLPVKWVIVDDGSTDDTARIATRYALKHPWIEVITMPRAVDRSFVNKVRAFNAGYEKVKSRDIEIIANIDADVSFGETYIEFLLDKFTEDRNLGVAGSVFKEDGYSTDKNSFEGRHHVPGGCQLFRKQCFDTIGGYLPNSLGGIDWIAVTTARMMGWTTRSFREVSFFHHRHLGTAERSRISALFSYGQKDYCLGGHPLWEAFRVLYRLPRAPYVLGGAALGAGYVWAMLRHAKRPVSRELMAFHRKEQMLKLSAILKLLLKMQPLDKFALLTE